MDTARSQVIRNHLLPLCHSARNAIKEVDPTDDLKFIRIRTQTNEIIIAPDQCATLTVFQQVNAFWNQTTDSSSVLNCGGKTAPSKYDAEKIMIFQVKPSNIYNILALDTFIMKLLPIFPPPLLIRPPAIKLILTLCILFEKSVRCTGLASTHISYVGT